MNLKTKADFEEGLRFYFDREFDHAVASFKRVLIINPDDKTAELYLRRSAKFVVESVVED